VFAALGRACGTIERGAWWAPEPLRIIPRCDDDNINTNNEA
jgi:hypothetical protein